MTRANTLPTMLRREMPRLLLQSFLSPLLFCIYGNDFGVPHVLRYSSFLQALAKDFVQWEQQFGLTVFDQVRDSILSTSP